MNISLDIHAQPKARHTLSSNISFQDLQGVVKKGDYSHMCDILQEYTATFLLRTVTVSYDRCVPFVGHRNVLQLRSCTVFINTA